MSLIRCDGCNVAINTDTDTETIRVLDGDCLCETCADQWARAQGREINEGDA